MSDRGIEIIVSVMIFTAPAFSFLVTLCVLAWLSRLKIVTAALDHPNQRSLHSTPVPRIGGIGMAAGIATGWLLISPALPPSIVAGGWVLFGLSLLDDVFGIPIAIRLAAHFLVATAFVVTVMSPATAPWLNVVVTLATVWMINLYNFMDGSDGLAGGMTLFGFTFYATAAWLTGTPELALTCAAIAAAAAAFLIFNFQPARIFMGDAGSIPLGFLAAAIGVAGWLENLWPAWFPILVFSPFIVDASATLVRRACRREKVWQAHREHYYQRLVQIGWGHRKTAVAEYALMVAVGLSGLWGLSLSEAGQIVLCTAWAAIYCVLMNRSDRQWRMFRAKRNP
jgi:UDP-N-acetylmuramyl pentapeptide phosphotransferase/UDP-N-acetylglucosamine-1-phosphate transferase